MATMRKPLQGVGNIIRFNWHFYIVAFVVVGVASVLGFALSGLWRGLAQLLALSVGLSTFISLVVSAYIYDFSGFYKLDWPASQARG